jgi:hypothetical protein
MTCSPHFEMCSIPKLQLDKNVSVYGMQRSLRIGYIRPSLKAI